MKDQYRFATMESLELQPCMICQGIGKTKCIICGQKCPAKKDLNEKQQLQLDSWRVRVAFLRKTYLQLIAMNQLTTGSEDVDAEIIRVMGDWKPYIKGRPAPWPK